MHLGSGDQGIFGFANRAKLGKLQANETERVELAYITSMISVNGDINEEKLTRKLNKIKTLNSQNITKATGADGIEYIVMSTETGLMYTINSITGVTVANIQDYENFKKSNSI